MRYDTADRAPGRLPFTVRRRGTVLLLSGLLVVAAAVAATRVQINADLVSYLQSDSPVVRAYHKVSETFGGNETGVVLVAAPDIYHPEVVSLIDSLTDAYQVIQGVDYVTSLTNTLEFTPTEWGIEVGRLVGRGSLPKSAKELTELRRRVDANPRHAGNLVSNDGTLAAIQIRLADDRGSGSHKSEFTEATVRRVIEVTQRIVGSRGSPDGVVVHFAGMPFLMHSISKQISENMAILLPLMVSLLLLVLYLGLRHWTGVVYPLVVVLMSSTIVLGVMGLIGLPLDMLSGLVPVVLIVLGSADGIHYMKRYYERRAQGETAAAAAGGTFRDIWVPLVLTTITTMVGFASLAISNVVIIRQFGLLTAAGLLFALIITLVLLPALSSFARGAPAPRTEGRSRGLGIIHRAVARGPMTLLAVGFVAVLIVGVGALRIVRSVDWTLCLKPGSTAHRAEILLRDKLSGSLPIQVLVRGDLLDPAVLREMRHLERRMEALPTVSKSQSLASLLAEMNAAVNGRYAIPATREEAANLWFLIEAEEAIEQLVARGVPTEGLVHARVADWETSSIHQAVEGVDEELAARRRVVASSGDNVSLAVALHEDQREDLATQLGWEFMSRRLDVPASVPAAARFFAEWVPDSAARSQVRDAVIRYLASEEAEVVIEAPGMRRLATYLARAAGIQGADSALVVAELRRVIPDLNERDRVDLALSLERITWEAMGRTRVDASMARLAAGAPRSWDDILQRNLSGAFWEAHTQPVVGNEEEADRRQSAANGVAPLMAAEMDRSGLTSVLAQMENELLPTQIQSVFLTLAVIIVLLSIMFRSLMAGVLMIVPLAATVVVNFGAMGYLSLGLDSFTAMVASIAIGLGVDYAIHFTHRYRVELTRYGGRMRDALRATLQTTGVAILVNTLALSSGYVVLLAATCQHIRRFGGLTALAMVVAGLFTLLMLPALYLKLRPRFLVARSRT